MESLAVSEPDIDIFGIHTPTEPKPDIPKVDPFMEDMNVIPGMGGIDFNANESKPELSLDPFADTGPPMK
jgi:hypothetical protein